MYSGALYNSVHADVFPESPEVSISSLGVPEPVPSLVTLRPPYPREHPQASELSLSLASSYRCTLANSRFRDSCDKKENNIFKAYRKKYLNFVRKVKEVSLKGRFNS